MATTTGAPVTSENRTALPAVLAVGEAIEDGPPTYLRALDIRFP